MDLKTENAAGILGMAFASDSARDSAKLSRKAAITISYSEIPNNYPKKENIMKTEQAFLETVAKDILAAQDDPTPSIDADVIGVAMSRRNRRNRDLSAAVLADPELMKNLSNAVWRHFRHAKVNRGS